MTPKQLSILYFSLTAAGVFLIVVGLLMLFYYYYSVDDKSKPSKRWVWITGVVLAALGFRKVLGTSHSHLPEHSCPWSLPQ